ncbi:MAG: crossover junction endodeoxyribonuclease RuvC [Clostridiaceae bacterium]|nr:crossover junction endodeoxyribonuclease RuvC [Clostridiaceae bacterium]
MTILGIDPGYAITGYGLVTSENQKILPLDFGVISTPPRVPFELRLLAIHDGVTALIKRYSPEVMAIEELFFNQNTTTAMGTAQARGVIILAAARFSLSVFEYKPSQVKNAVTGYGKADKKQVQQMVKTILGLAEVPQPDDAADALAVAIAQANRGSVTYAQKLRGGYQ